MPGTPAVREAERAQGNPISVIARPILLHPCRLNHRPATRRRRRRRCSAFGTQHPRHDFCDGRPDEIATRSPCGFVTTSKAKKKHHYSFLRSVGSQIRRPRPAGPSEGIGMSLAGDRSEMADISFCSSSPSADRHDRRGHGTVNRSPTAIGLNRRATADEPPRTRRVPRRRCGPQAAHFFC